jgi:hypothetical protein
MKNVLLLLLFFFTSAILSASKLSNGLPLSLITGQEKISVDKDLVLNIFIENGHRLLRVSFNGSEGSEGDLKIFNPAHEVNAEFNFELIKYPNYATVDLTDLTPGNYLVELSTKIAVHTATLSIQ